MKNKSKVMLSKVASLLKRNDMFGNKHWPAYVLSTLEKKYQLSPKEMLRLWYIRRKISNGKHPVDSLLIYDWAQANARRIRVRSSRDLDNNSDLLLFKGNIFGDGSVRIERTNN